MTERQIHNVAPDRLLAFGFGVIFVGALLIIALLQPDPSDFSYTIFRIIIALAAAGVGAVIPGFLNVSFKNTLRAGGAVAFFVVVYFLPPASIVSAPHKDDPPPLGYARPIAEAWLKQVDSGHIDAAYASMASFFKARFAEPDVVDLIQRERSALGVVERRQFQSAGTAKDPPGDPRGYYQSYSYATKFTREPRTIYETVVVYGDKNVWKVAGFFAAVQNADSQYVPYEPPLLNTRPHEATAAPR